MNKKVITGALAGVLSTGVVLPAMANTNKDAATIYRNAYDATMKAKNFTSENVNEVQTVILEARTAIKELKELATEKDNAEWLGNVNDWSTIVDGVQQPILSKIIKVVEPMLKDLEAGKAVTQDQINKAVALIPTELPSVWKNDYTSITDKAQTKLIDEAFKALKAAEAGKTSALVKEAQAKIDVIKTSTKEAVKVEAGVFQNRLDAIKLYDLNVTKVVELNKTSVKVEFDALEEAIKDVTIEVIDNKGKVQEVKAQRVIDTDVTEARFVFTTALKDAPEGEWTINGVKYDAQKDRIVEKVLNVNTSQKDLLAALESGYFENVDANLIVKYKAEFKNIEDKDKNVAGIQKAIDKVNSTVDKEAYVPAIKEAVKAGNEIKLLAALEKAPLDRVNGEWISEYMTALKGVENFEGIEKAIKDVNEDKVNSAEAIALISFDSELVDKAEALINDYVTAETKEEKELLEKRLKALNVRYTLINIVTSETKSELKSSLNKIVELEKESFKDVKINEYLMDKYLDAISASNIKETNANSEITIGVIKFEINRVNFDGIEEAIAVIKTEAGNFVQEKPETVKKFKDSLVKLDKVVGDNKVFDITIVKDSNLKEYAEGMKNVTSINEVITAINKVNTGESVGTILKTIKEAKTATDVEKALVQYRDLTSNETLVNGGNLGLKDTALEIFKLENRDLNESQLRNAIIDVQAVIKAKVNAVNVAETNIQLRAAIKAITGESLSVDKLEAFNANRPKDKDGNNTPFKNYTEIRTVLNK